MPAAYKIRLAALRHGTVAYTELGAGSPLVLVHGLGGNWQNWLGNLPRLAERHRVVALDLPGFGLSSHYPGEVTMARHADTLIELLDELAIPSATLVGNSMGGLLTIEAAARYPERVHSAVLVSSGGIPLNTVRHRLVLLPLSLAINRTLRHRTVRRAVLRHPVLRHVLASGIVRDARAVETRRMVAALDGLGARGFGPTLFAALRYDARHSAPAVGCPTLILWGRQDRLLPLWMGRKLHRLIRGSELVVWDDTGHCPMIEHPERFDALVAGWVAGRSARQALSSGG